MPFWVYILQSETTGKLYTGQTSDLGKRLREHNEEEIGRRRFTRKQSGPWRLLYFEEMPTRSEAMRRETHLKTGKGREWIRQNILNGHLVHALPPQEH
jgi:putative endonuclease